MDGIGIVINLHLIPRRISPKEWREVYQESLKLVEAYDFMDRIEARRNGLRYFFAQKSKDRPLFMNREGHGWLAVGDLRTGEGTGEFMLSEDIHAYMPDEGTRRQRKDRGEEILLNSLEGMNGVKKPQGCVNIWGNQTRGTDSHIYLLAIACLIVSRFPEAAMVSGDISVGQCRRAVRWANQYLVKEIGLPVTGQMDRLLVRLGSSALPEKDYLNPLYQLTDEAKGTQMGDFLRKEFSREEIYDYYRQRFLPYQAGQRGFARVMKEYLEMGFDFQQLCRLAVTDPNGVQAEPEEFLRRILESKLHIREKETFDFAKAARERADQEENDREGDLPARIFCMLTGIENKNVNAYYPLSKIREDCKKVFGDKYRDIDALIDHLIAEEEEVNARRDSLQAILYDNADGMLRQGLPGGAGGKGKQPGEETYEINSYRELAGFTVGCHMKPSLEEDLIRNFCALHSYTGQTFEEFCSLKREERENYLIQMAAGLLLREEVWDRIFCSVMDDAYIERIYGILSVNREQRDGELFCRSLFSNLKAIDYYWEKTKAI